MEDLLSAQVAEITVLELAVVVTVHIGENLQYGVFIKFELQLVSHISEIGEGD